MKMKIIDALRLLDEREKAENQNYRVRHPYKGIQGKKISFDDEQLIADLSKQDIQIKEIYHKLNGKYHYDTVWKYVHKYRDHSIAEVSA